MPIRSLCPKCGREGSQSITYAPSKSNPKYQYLVLIHGEHDRCYIGRVRTTEEFMGELSKPETKEE